ncbi:MAG: hypothetical protein LC635_05865 [Pseudonocardiaceae bacterium]|nr:hypothetical protein [Pseudonocardiaceae bacterium]
MASRRGRRAALRLSALLATTGTLHLAMPKPFDALVPSALPGSARFWTYASGVAELGVSGMLALPRTRRVGGSLAALLFIAVFPGNVSAVRRYWHRPWPRAAMIARLPLQVPLVTEALKARE